MSAPWMSDPKRSYMAREGINRRARELRKVAKEMRVAFKQDYMNIPCQWTADVYCRAAAVLEAALTEIDDAFPHEPEEAI